MTGLHGVADEKDAIGLLVDTQGFSRRLYIDTKGIYTFGVGNRGFCLTNLKA